MMWRNVPCEMRPQIRSTMWSLVCLSFLLLSLTIGCKDNPDELIKELNDPDLKVRQDAARKLGEIKDPHAIQPLIELMRKHSDNLGSLCTGAYF